MGVKLSLLLLVLLQLALICKANRENYREENELEDERRMLDVNVDGHNKYVDLDKEKKIKGTPPPSRDEINQHDIENDEEDDWDIKEDERNMMVDEFEDVDEEETRPMNDRNKHALTDTNQKKQDPFITVHYYRRRYVVYYYRRRNYAPYRRRRRWLKKK